VSNSATFLRREPKQDRSRERLATLLDSTSAMLAKEGAEGLTVSGIADNAGLPASSVYEYVGELVDLVALTTMRSLDAIEASIAEAAEGVSDEKGAKALLRKTLATVATAYADEPGLAAGLALPDSSAETAGIRVGHSRRVAEIVTEAIRPSVPSKRRRNLVDRVFLLVHLSHAAVSLQDADADSAKGVERDYRKLLESLIEE